MKLMHDDYDARLREVEERNEFILGHFVHVWRERISDDTLYQHVRWALLLADGALTGRLVSNILKMVQRRSADQMFN